MVLRREVFPAYLRRFLPCISYSNMFVVDHEVVGLFASDFLASGSELLLDYNDCYSLAQTTAAGKERSIDWLESDRVRIDEEYLVKREFEFDLPPTAKKLLGDRVPPSMRPARAQLHLQLLSRSSDLMQRIVDSQTDPK